MVVNTIQRPSDELTSESNFTLSEIEIILLHAERLLKTSGSITTSHMMKLVIAAWAHELPDLEAIARGANTN